MDKLSQPTNYDKRLYSLKDYEELANTRFDRHANDYYNSGANDEISLNNQEGVYKSIKLKTRVFVDPNKFQGTETQIMGTKIWSPICITSTAFQRMANYEGECATARACEVMNRTPFVLSSWATTSNEDVGVAAPNCVKVMQLYMSKIPEVNLDIWARIKKSGFTALALTTDTQLLGKRLNNERRKFSLPSHLKMENYAKYQ